MTFGQWLRNERLARNWTQAELAERAALSSQAIGLLETGKRKPGRQTAVGLARAFNTTADAVLAAADDTPLTTIAQLRSEGIPADVLADLEHYAPDLLPDDWEMMVEVVRQTARRNAQREQRRRGGSRPAAQDESEPDSSEPRAKHRTTARGLSRMRA